jgi:heptosyltransferase I
MIQWLIDREKMGDAPTRFLIVKTSSLGDVIQAFSALNYLCSKFPLAKIDWVVEERFASIVAAHPLVQRAISFDIKRFKKRWRQRGFWHSLWKSWRAVRRARYDAVFDLQGNCKSGVITFLSRSASKVGFGKKSVREWPNILATKTRFEIPRDINIRLQYVKLIQMYFQDDSSFAIEGVRFKIPQEAKERLEHLLKAPELQTQERVMVCPGSKWINKQLPFETLVSLLGKIEEAMHCSFLLMWGAEEEKEMCQAIQRRFSHCSAVIEKLELPLWQNLIAEADLVIAVDSSALHLSGTTSTPTFSIFGPTSPEIFKPVGPTHYAYRGACPYLKVFEKQCPLLRSCATGACIRNISADVLFDHFWSWWQNQRAGVTADRKQH